MTAMTESQWMDLMTEHELAYFRADFCLGSPQSFSPEEKAQTCDDMEATNKAIEDAISADFEGLPPQLQGKLLDMPRASGCMTPEWWRETLFGKIPDSPEEIV